MDQQDRLTGSVVLVVQIDVRGVLFANRDERHNYSLS
jgi:hypothetical protein